MTHENRLWLLLFVIIIAAFAYIIWQVDEGSMDTPEGEQAAYLQTVSTPLQAVEQSKPSKAYWVRSI